MTGWAPHNPYDNGLGPPWRNDDKGDNGPGPHGPTDNWKDPTAHTMMEWVTPQPRKWAKVKW